VTVNPRFHDWRDAQAPVRVVGIRRTKHDNPPLCIGLWVCAIVTILVSLAFASPLLAAEDEAESDSSAGLPEAYAKNYLVAASTLSPDKRLAVIYPKRDPEEFPKGKDYIVSLEPFAVVGSLDTKWPYFYHQNHAAISATWSDDSSIALVTIDSKWGPGEIFLLEFADGKLKRATNLLANIHALLLPDYRKVKPQRYNDYFDFIFEDDSESIPVCQLDGTKLVQIEATATTDPKHMAGTRAWDARVRATWDIAQAKFTSQKVTRLFGGVRKENGDD
jgi:hypothetical protein